LQAAKAGQIKDVTVTEKPSAWDDEMEAVYSKDPLLVDADMNTDPEDADMPIDTSTEVSFPDMVERDMLSHVQAIQAAAIAGGVGSDGTAWEEYITRQLLMALGERSIEETLDEMYPEEVEGEEETPPLAVDPGLVPAPGVNPFAPPIVPEGTTPLDAEVQTEAVRQALLNVKGRAEMLLEARRIADAHSGCSHE
jgi:hypothetical protein